LAQGKPGDVPRCCRCGLQQMLRTRRCFATTHTPPQAVVRLTQPSSSPLTNVFWLFVFFGLQRDPTAKRQVVFESPPSICRATASRLGRRFALGSHGAEACGGSHLCERHRRYRAVAIARSGRSLPLTFLVQIRTSWHSSLLEKCSDKAVASSCPTLLPLPRIIIYLFLPSLPTSP
jgi:hypothetical protein